MLDAVHDDEHACEEEGQPVPAFVVVLEFLVGVIGVVGGNDTGVGGVEGDEVGEHHQSSCCHEGVAYAFEGGGDKIHEFLRQIYASQIALRYFKGDEQHQSHN